MKNLKDHWEAIYSSKKMTEVSWYQEKPQISLEFIKLNNPGKDAKIIDVGGGDSFLVDHLLAEGFSKLTVLDISKAALEKAKKRLGDKAKKVTWIETDITKFKPTEKYDVWHDRAALHFLTEDKQVEKYAVTIHKTLSDNGIVVLATFSEKGPQKCSGIEIKRYSLHELADLLKENFEIVQCENVDHITPTGAVQNFSFCSFKRK